MGFYTLLLLHFACYCQNCETQKKYVRFLICLFHRCVSSSSSSSYISFSFFFFAFLLLVCWISVVLFYRTQIAMFVDHLDGFRICKLYWCNKHWQRKWVSERVREIKMPMCITYTTTHIYKDQRSKFVIQTETDNSLLVEYESQCNVYTFHHYNYTGQVRPKCQIYFTVSMYTLFDIAYVLVCIGRCFWQKTKYGSTIQSILYIEIKWEKERKK